MNLGYDNATELDPDGEPPPGPNDAEATLLAKALNARGYLVMSSDTPLKIGTIFEGETNVRSGRFVRATVESETDVADYLGQARVLGLEDPKPFPFNYRMRCD